MKVQLYAKLMQLFAIFLYAEIFIAYLPRKYEKVLYGSYCDTLL